MSSLKALLSVAVLSVALCGCGSKKEWFTSYSGNMPSNEKIEKIHEGLTKDEVKYILGAPSSVVSLDKNTWIYMSSEIEQIAFLEPKEISRDILTIRFDDNNVVKEVTRSGIKDGKSVNVAEEETESLGHKKGFFERFFGGTQTYAPMGGGSQGKL